MKKKSKIKVSRGYYVDIEMQKKETLMTYQRVTMFLLPVMMIAVLAIGLYFGYKSYTRGQSSVIVNHSATVAQDSLTKSQKEYLLTVINSAHTVDKDFVPDVTDFGTVKVSPLVKSDLSSMINAAKQDGVELKVVSGYISFEEQSEIYESAVKNYKKKHKSTTVKAESAVKATIPKPGESEQQTGLLIEFGADTDDFVKSPQYRWLNKNSVDYGFVLRYPNDDNTGGLKFSPKLFRYVGVENAKQMRVYNMNLDEFVSYVSSH